MTLEKEPLDARLFWGTGITWLMNFLMLGVEQNYFHGFFVSRIFNFARTRAAALAPTKLVGSISM